MIGRLGRLLGRRCAGTLAQRQGLAMGYGAPITGGFVPESPRLVLHALFTNNNTILTLCRRVAKGPSSSAESTAKPGRGNEVVFDQAAMIQAVRPQQEVILTVTTGQLGFRGTRKSTYDAAFQTTAKMFAEMEARQLVRDDIEIVARNFGQNREAFFKVLFGKEGTRIRPLIKRISDGTRIKFGGNRSPNKRRI